MNLASTLKSEIARISRKELRGEITPLKKSSAAYRADIASLKRRIATLEQLIKRMSKGAQKLARDVPQEANDQQFRYSAKSMAAQRKRLGLSAAAFGQLLGVSAQSVYHWEQGKSRPRASQMQAILTVRRLGKRQAAELLASGGDS